MDINKTEWKGLDQAFFCDFAETETFTESLDMKSENVERFYLTFDEFFKLGAKAFFCDFAETETFTESLARQNTKSQKILDIMRDFMYYRLDSFEIEELKESLMPATMRADVTHIVKPWFDRGRQEGELRKAIETARIMVARGMDISLIEDLTGLTKQQLRKHGITQ